MKRLVLASQSPRRLELLSRLGLPFVTDAPLVDESVSLPAPEAVRMLSLRKAFAASSQHPGSWIIGADTLGYLRYEDVKKIAEKGDCKGFCLACFDEKYPTKVPSSTKKNKFEQPIPQELKDEKKNKKKGEE